MVLILDSCSIFNILLVFQDVKYFSLIKSNFREVHITKEVYQEVETNKAKLFAHFNDRDELNQLIKDAKLESLFSKNDSDKKDCISFTSHFAGVCKLEMREDGEYHSSLLALYLSRLGGRNVFENLGRITLATDDSPAYKIYSKFYSLNYIGRIVDSVDLMALLYIKNIISKDAILRYIDGLINLYYKDFNKIKFIIEEAKVTEGLSKYQSELTMLIEFVHEANVVSILEFAGNPGHSNLLKRHQRLRDALKNFKDVKFKEKLHYLRGRREEIRKDLVWKV